MFFRCHQAFYGRLFFSAISAVALLICSSCALAAQEDELNLNDRPPLSITELLDIALNYHPQTRAAWWNAKRAAAVKDLAANAYYPAIGFSGSFANGLDYRYINGQTTNYTTVSGDIILSYLLYDFGERSAACDAAKAALQAANWQSDWTLQKVMYQVICNTYTYLNAQEQLIAKEASLQDAKTALEAASELQRVGLRSMTDIYALKAVFSEAKIDIALQRAQTNIAHAQLAASLGLDVNSKPSIATLPDPKLEGAVQTDIKMLIDSAWKKRSDLMATRSQLQKKIAEQTQLKRSYLPKINVSGDTGYRRYFEDRANGYNYNIGLYLDVPLFNGFEQTYQKNKALSELQMSEIEVEQVELEVALDVLTYSHLFSAAQEVLSLAQENLQNSLLTFQGVLDKYKAGIHSIFDLTSAQRQLADARLKYGDAKTSWYRSLAQLAYSTGTIMPTNEVPCVTID